MAAFVLQVSVGDVSLGTVRQSHITKRWEVAANGRVYTFRDPDAAAEALQMLAETPAPAPEPGEPMPPETEAGLRACIEIANREIARLSAIVNDRPLTSDVPF